MNKKYLKITLMLLPILLAGICLLVVIKNNNQAFMPIPMPCAFVGEYSYDGENWYSYSEDCDMSAYDGDVIVKGHLNTDVAEGGVLNFFCNHIGVTVSINGEVWYMDTISELKNRGINLMASMCGKRWGQVLFPEITTADEIEFHFTNHHKHGNGTAYKEVLSSLYLTPQDNTILEVYLKPYVKPFETIGSALMVVAIMLLGASLSAAVLKSSIANRLFKMGIATVFAGGFVVLDIMMVYLMDELLVVKTYGSQLCLMLAVYFLGIIICEGINGSYKKVAEVAMAISGIINAILICLAITGKILLYDTQVCWKIAQCVISILLIVFCILELKRKKKQILEWIVYISINLAILIDMTGIDYGMYYSYMCFKVVYVIMLIVLLFLGTKQVVLNHQASIKNKKLKAELEQSRIAVMLSQIQPHFLYNSLTSVMDLCDTNPKKAKNAIADFADYLRGNLDSLKTENLIFFKNELQHIEKYLRLEKLRFQEELNIVYDIQTQDFMLPTLSVQPLVENAVKHGVGQKTGGGTVTIQTTETEDEYIIRVMDDGVGFVVDEIVKDNSERVGIDNIRKRLDMMLQAKLEIDSKIGEGTTAYIRISKKKEES